MTKKLINTTTTNAGEVADEIIQKMTDEVVDRFTLESQNQVTGIVAKYLKYIDLLYNNPEKIQDLAVALENLEKIRDNNWNVVLDIGKQQFRVMIERDIRRYYERDFYKRLKRNKVPSATRWR